MKIGVLAESFRKDFKTSLKSAASLGVQGVQVYANSATINADMSKAEMAEVKNMLSGEGLVFSALCGDFGCKMFYCPKESALEIERPKKILAHLHL